jgi:hypothetical protein
MGILRQGPPEQIVLHLAERYRIGSFVETGTFLGNTAAWAARHFEQVYTVEFSETIYHQAAARHASIKNISFLYGDTRARLAEIVPLLGGPSLFWLDAHWSGGQTYGESDECPLLDEIDAIDRMRDDSFILIDDARLFLAPPPRPHRAEQWPDLATVLAKLNQRAERYVVVLEDVIVATPGATRAALADYYQDLATQAWSNAQRTTPAPSIAGQARQLYRGVRSRLRRGR